MRYHVLAADYDGTLAEHGVVSPSTVAALERLTATGRKLVLVTGRQLDDLLEVFPEIELCDRVVAENGALLYCPATRERRPLGPPPPPEFVKTLRKRGVAPLAVGASIVATEQPHESTVLETIRDLGLELQVIFNKGAVMVLPASVNKATGLAVALDELGLSARNVAAIGDAENDHALLQAAEYGVAVANSVPALQREADRISKHVNGNAVVELIDHLLEHDLAKTPPRKLRRPLLLGTRTGAQGKEEDVYLPQPCRGVLVTGSSGSGKSTLATGLLERLAAHGYQFCVIDPEGDYEAFGEAIVFGSAERGPTAKEVLTALEKPHANVVVNLVGLPLGDRPAFFLGLLPRLQELRAKTGRPHWILIDETHHLMPLGWDPAPVVLAHELAGIIYVTVHPEWIAAPILKNVNVVCALGEQPDDTLRKFAKGARLTVPKGSSSELEAGHALVWHTDGGDAPFTMQVAPTHAEHRRHVRKYAVGELPVERSFFFRGPEDKLNLRAQNLVLFLQLAAGVDDDTWMHHLRRGDYSRWLREAIKDDGLAERVAEVEEDEEATPATSRERIKSAIEEQYTMPAEGEGVA